MIHHRFGMCGPHGRRTGPEVAAEPKLIHWPRPIIRSGVSFAEYTIVIVGVVKERVRGERRVAVTPQVVPSLCKAGLDVRVEAGAGMAAGYADGAYEGKAATIVSSRAEIVRSADVLLQVWTAVAKSEAADDLPLLRDGQTVIGLGDPLGGSEVVRALAERRVRSFALELLPRITRAQSMDALSSQATIAGYKAVLLAANHLPKMFPMMMTAAGTIAAAKVFVIGAGVAGLQAIASARRLGAIVSAYDIRPTVKEQIHSLGASFVELPLETGEAEDKGGYAKAMDEAFYRKQRELLGKVVAESDVVITTASIPGKASPVLVTAEMVGRMAPGSVIIDLAAERGGNCELTAADGTVEHGGVTILGPTNLPATVPYHASQMYAKNISAFLLNMVKDGALAIDRDDEIVRDTLITDDGAIVNDRVRTLLSLTGT